MKLLLLTALALAAAPLAAKTTPAVQAPITAFFDGFNKGDTAAAGATNAADVTIIDELPPFLWQGPGAFKAWLADLGKYDAALGNTDGHVANGAAAREVVSGDRAYVVVPAVYSFTRKGVAMREPAQFTFVLHKDKPGWKIISWTFSGPDPKPAK